MSLTVDGAWKVGVWATTVWADGVWAEGGVTIEEMDGGGKKKRRQSIYDDLPDYRLAPQPQTEYVPPVPVIKIEAEKFIEPKSKTSMALALEKAGVKTQTADQKPDYRRRKIHMLLLDY